MYRHMFQSLPRIFTCSTEGKVPSVLSRKQHMTAAATLFRSMLARSFLLFFFLFFLFIETEVGRSQSAAVRFSTRTTARQRWTSGTAEPDPNVVFKAA